MAARTSARSVARAGGRYRGHRCQQGGKHNGMPPSSRLQMNQRYRMRHESGEARREMMADRGGTWTGHGRDMGMGMWLGMKGRIDGDAPVPPERPGPLAGLSCRPRPWPNKPWTAPSRIPDLFLVAFPRTVVRAGACGLVRSWPSVVRFPVAVVAKVHVPTRKGNCAGDRVIFHLMGAVMLPVPCRDVSGPFPARQIVVISCCPCGHQGTSHDAPSLASRAGHPAGGGARKTKIAWR